MTYKNAYTKRGWNEMAEWAETVEALKKEEKDEKHRNTNRRAINPKH